MAVLGRDRGGAHVAAARALLRDRVLQAALRPARLEP